MWLAEPDGAQLCEGTQLLGALGAQHPALIGLEEDLDGTPARLGAGGDRVARCGARVARDLLGMLGHQSLTREM